MFKYREHIVKIARNQAFLRQDKLRSPATKGGQIVWQPITNNW
jgi:hypothetical protein